MPTRAETITMPNPTPEINIKMASGKHHGVSNHRPFHCFFNGLYWSTPKKTSRSTLLVLCERNPPVTGGFPSQGVSNAENTWTMSWRHHGKMNQRGLRQRPWDMTICLNLYIIWELKIRHQRIFQTLIFMHCYISTSLLLLKETLCFDSNANEVYRVQLIISQHWFK